jgi:hypothetical protein
MLTELHRNGHQPMLDEDENGGGSAPSNSDSSRRVSFSNVNNSTTVSKETTREELLQSTNSFQFEDLERNEGRQQVLQGQIQEEEDDDQDGILNHEIPLWQRLYRRRCCLCTSFLLFCFFIWGVTATNNACWAKMSPAHSSNRRYNNLLFLSHINKGDSSQTEASVAILGKKPNQEVRFLIVGNSGRDGFCYQTDIAYEMERAAKSAKVHFVVNTGNLFFPSGLVSRLFSREEAIIKIIIETNYQFQTIKS